MGHTITVNDDKLYNSIVEYCRDNGLKISSFCTALLKDAFFTEKYGDIPFGTIKEKNESENEIATFTIPEEIRRHVEESVAVKTAENNESMDVKMEEVKEESTNIYTPIEEPIIVKPKKRRL